MKKKILITLIAVCTMLFAFGMINASAETYGDLTYSVSNGEITITDCNSYATTVEIPSEIDGYPVTSIDNNAFFGCYNLTSITIPNGVRSIGNFAFSGCSSLTNITIPDSVKSIGNLAFSDCSSLTNITIPDSVKSIGNLAFSECSSLTNITIPDSVKSIGERAFRECTSLTSITIGKNIASIGLSPFRGCTNVNKVYYNAINCTTPSMLLYEVGSSKGFEVIIGDDVTHIPVLFLDDNENVTKVTIGKNVTNIGESAFRNCISMTNIDIPDCVKIIEQYAFWGCTGLTDVKMGKNITQINDEAFYGCSGLTEIVLPNSLEHIGNSAFKDCINLVELTIPKGVTYIGNEAFVGLNNLKTVYYNPANCNIYPYSGRSFSTSGSPNGLKVIFGDSVENIPQEFICDNPNVLEITLGTGIKNINYNAFRGCTNLKKVNIKSLESWLNIEIANDTHPLYIGGKLYLNNEPVTDIIIPESIAYIKPYSFYNCTDLKSLYIPENVTKIGDYAFYSCTELSNIILPDSIEQIGSKAFYNTAYYNNEENWENSILYLDNWLVKVKDDFKFNEFNIKSDVTGIAGSAFENCLYLTEIAIPNNIKNVGNDAFKGCSELKIIKTDNIKSWLEINFSNTYANPLMYGGILYIKNEPVNSIVIPSELTSIKNYAFSGYKALSDVTMHENIIDIGTGAFYGCTGLTDIVVPNSVKRIGNVAFSTCTGLRNISLGTSVSSIGSSAFYGCVGLSEIKLPKNISSIASSTFYGCTGLSSVEIPNGVTRIEYGAFYNCTGLTEINIPSTVTNIGFDAFCNCAKLGVVRIDDLTNWFNIDFAYATANPLFNGGNLYLNNKLLTSVTTPAEVTSIKDYTFYGYKGLEELTIGEKVTNISNWSFNNCTGLKKVNYNAINCNDFMGSLNWLTGSGSNEGFSVVIGKKVEKIPSSFLYTNSKVAEVIIPASVKYIGSSAFCNCIGLKKVYYDAVGYIDTNGCCFSWSGSKDGFEIIIGDNVKVIPNSCFLDSDVTKVTLGKNVEIIEEGAFGNCDDLVEINMPESIKRIGEGAFNECKSLKKVVIPDSVEIIEDLAFSDCDSLTELTIGKNVTSIGIGAFRWCDNLQALYYNAMNCVDYPGGFASAFDSSGKSDDFKVVIGNSVEKIPDDFMDDVTAVVEMTIPNSVNGIGYSALDECENLITINFIGTENQWINIINNTRIPSNTVINFIPPISVTGVSLNTDRITIFENEKGNLIETVFPETSTNKRVLWKSNNESVATVSNGVVTGISEGTTTITVTTVDGEYLAACVVNIISKPEISAFKVIKSGTSATVNFSATNVPDNAIIYVATYASDNKLLEVKTLTLINGSAEETFLLKDVDKFKSFIWDENLAPLCEANDSPVIVD